MLFSQSSLLENTIFVVRLIAASRPSSQLVDSSAVILLHAQMEAAVTPKVCLLSNPLSETPSLMCLGQCGFRDEHCKSNCVANCNATAPCGVNSRNGSQMCPLNICCSYFGFCGTTDFFCRDTTASGQSTPCQKQYGTCGNVTPPICGPDDSTASRKVAYYEAW